MIIPSNNGYQWLYNHYITIDLSLGDIWWFIVNSSGYHFFSMKHWALRHHQGIPTCRCRILVPGPPLEPLEVGFPGTWAFQWSDATQNMLVESGYWQLYILYYQGDWVESYSIIWKMNISISKNGAKKWSAILFRDTYQVTYQPIFLNGWVSMIIWSCQVPNFCHRT